MTQSADEAKSLEPPIPEWRQTRMANCNKSQEMTPITALRFDPVRELILAGTQGGWLNSLHSLSMQTYTSARAHAYNESILDLYPYANGCLSVSQSEIRFHSPGCVLENESLASKLLSPLEIVCCAEDVSSQGSSLLLGCNISPQHAAAMQQQQVDLSFESTQASLLLFDVTSDAVVHSSLCASPYTCLSQAQDTLASNGALLCGRADGAIDLRDVRSHRIEQTLQCMHVGALTDLTVTQSGLLLTCGYSAPPSMHYARASRLDAFATVTDLRMLSSSGQTRFEMPRQLVFGGLGGALLCESSRDARSSVWLTSQHGTFQCLDAELALANDSVAATREASLYQLQSASGGQTFVTSMHLSSSEQTICFGDASGIVHQWTQSKYDDASTVNGSTARINTHSQTQEIPTTVDERDAAASPLPFMTESDSLSCFQLPFFAESAVPQPLASDRSHAPIPLVQNVYVPALDEQLLVAQGMTRCGPYGILQSKPDPKREERAARRRARAQ